VTGVTLLNVEIAAKRLQLLNELIPTAPSIAALLDPGTGNPLANTVSGCEANDQGDHNSSTSREAGRIGGTRDGAEGGSGRH
jgi:hypothetical protein